MSSLRSALRRGTLHHAYLFGGPEGVGKATRRAPPRPGGELRGRRRRPGGRAGRSVRRLRRRAGRSRAASTRTCSCSARSGRWRRPALWEPKGGRTPSKDIVVDQVRDVVDRRLALKRFEGRRRFVILDPADAMNPQAQNALLKTLEEPPARDDARARRVEPRRAPPDDPLALPARAVRASPRGRRRRAARGRRRARERGAPRRRAGGRLARAGARARRGDARRPSATRCSPRRRSTRRRRRLARVRAGARRGSRGAAELCALLALWLRDVARRPGWARRELALGDLAEATRRAAAAIPPRRGAAPARGGPEDGGGAPPERRPRRSRSSGCSSRGSMAAGRGDARRARGGRDASRRASRRCGPGRPRPVYLLDGDAFLALRAARELAAALVPEAQRALNLVELDAAASPGRGRARSSPRAASSAAARSCSSTSPRSSPPRRTRRAAFARAREAVGEGRAARRRAAAPRARRARRAGRAKDLAPGATASDRRRRSRGTSACPHRAYDAAFVEAAARLRGRARAEGREGRLAARSTRRSRAGFRAGTCSSSPQARWTGGSRS